MQRLPRLQMKFTFMPGTTPYPKSLPTQGSHAIETQPLKLREPCILTYLPRYPSRPQADFFFLLASTTRSHIA
jgi:hypothetical protein